MTVAAWPRRAISWASWRAAGEMSASAVAQLERSLAIAEALHDSSSRIAALNNLALARAESGDLAAGHRSG